MNPRTSSKNPATPGKLSFHVIIDELAMAFSVDGPDGANGVWLQAQQVARMQKRKLRDFDVRAFSHDEALATIHEYYPGYRFAGSWNALRAMGKD